VALLNKQKTFPVAIFEDDCIMLEPWSVVEEAMNQLPPAWDALYLGANLQKPVERYSENLYKLFAGHATHAVIYNSRRLIDFVIDHYNVRDYRCFDVLMAYEAQKLFNVFTIYPLVATQRACMSDINDKFLDNYATIVDSYAKMIKR